jgi:hypothetical protein
VLQVSIPTSKRSFNGIGSKCTVFEVHIVDGVTDQSVDLDDLDFTYLHEQLLAQGRSVPPLPKQGFTLFDSDSLIESRRVGYERYLREVLECADCVVNPILWVTLGVSVESSIVQRFVVRGDNVHQIDELSSRVSGYSRIASVGIITTLLRIMVENHHDLHTISHGVSILTRIAGNPGSIRLVQESYMLPVLMRLLTSVNRPILNELVISIVESFPGSLFNYIQREGGLTELIEVLDSKPGYDELFQTVATCVWYGSMLSRDIEIVLTDKSSVGMSLLNKLLVRGEGTETELIATVTLASLYRKNLVIEYSQKIKKIIDSLLTSDNYNFGLRFLYGPRFFKTTVSLLFNQGALNDVDDSCIQLGSYLITCYAIKQTCLEDLEWFERNGLKEHFLSKLGNVIKIPKISESAKHRSVEATLMLNADCIYLETIKRIISSKIQKSNNFLITTNFELSSKSFPNLLPVELVERYCSLFSESRALIAQSNEGQSKLHEQHTNALNEVVSGMFQLKSWTKELDQISEECTRRSHDERVNHIDPASCCRKEEYDKLRILNFELIKAQKIFHLYSSIEEMDKRYGENTKRISQLKTVLIKMKNHVDQILEEIDIETGSSPLSP